MRSIAVLVTSVLALVSAPGATTGPAPVTLHVAVDGDDARSGSTRDAALASPRGARDRIRALKRERGELGEVHVVFHEGIYTLPEPFVIEPGDSGRADAPIEYAAAEGERVVFSGGVRVSTWTRERDGVWSIAIPADGIRPRSLWVDDRRVQRAGAPAAGHFLRVDGFPEGEPKGDWTKGQRGFVYAESDAPTWDRVEPGAEVVTFTRWVDTHLVVESIDRSARVVRFSSPNVFELSRGDLYRVEGAPGLLDEDGEWCDSGDRALLRSDAEPRSVVVPRLTTLVRCAGTPESNAFVEYVRFSGIRFEHARWWFDANSTLTWPSKDVVGFVQAAAGAPGAIVADGARHVEFDRCAVAHVDGYGIEFGRACVANAIRRCTIEDLGAGGVKIGETAERDDPLVARDNVVEDCVIRDGGRVHHQAVGVWIGQSGGNRLSHNLISDFDYSGISIGWTWGYGPSRAIGNIVEFNEVRNLGARAGNAEPPLGDMAGIYTLGTQADATAHTTIRDNWFHDIAGRTIAWGIYFDEGSTGIVAERNLVQRTTHGSFHQHYGRDNVVRNNLFFHGRDAQLWRSKREPHNSFTLERNVVLRATGAMLNGDWTDGFVSRSNIFWSVDGVVVFPGNRTFAEWAKAAHDEGSIVADPRAMPDSPTPWKLGPDSPAPAMGIEPLDLSTVGPRGSAPLTNASARPASAGRSG
ncbi:MAG: right-handed parallel beta-helix repeat-containing protein [Phycisphaerales bacterium]